jgi:hypothetical protein
MRQFFCVLSFVFYAFALAACGSGDVPVVSAPQPDAASMEAQKVASSDPQVSDIVCPKIEMRTGTETLRTFDVGSQNNASDLAWQATILSTARECSILGAEVGIKAGVSGRVLLGPKGKSGTFSVPVRIAVVRNGTEPLWSRVSSVDVTMPSGEASAVFTAVVEDILFPREPNDNLSNVQIYTGFDPEGAKAAAKTPKGKAKPKR